MSCAIWGVVGVPNGLPKCAEAMTDAWFRVTMLEIGVVSNLAKLPARNPTPNSSRAGKAASKEALFRAAILLDLIKLYARKKRNESAIVFPVSANTPM